MFSRLVALHFCWRFQHLFGQEKEGTQLNGSIPSVLTHPFPVRQLSRQPESFDFTYPPGSNFVIPMGWCIHI